MSLLPLSAVTQADGMSKDAIVLDARGEVAVDLLDASVYRSIVWGQADPFSQPRNRFRGRAPLTAEGKLRRDHVYRVRVDGEIFQIRLQVARASGRLGGDRWLNLYGRAITAGG